MKVLLEGCGAVGISVATALCLSGVETDLMARGKTAEAIREGGIARRGILGDAEIPPEKIRVFENIDSAGKDYDFILNCAKSTANADIAKNLMRRKDDILSPGGRIVLFQNGYGNERAFEAVFDKRRIYHASLAIGFRRTKPNVSEATVITAPVSIGSLFGEPAGACSELAEAIDKGGVPCGVTDEIGKTLWAKMLYNCTLNPLGAILGTDYGGLVRSDGSIAIMKNIIDEIFLVMHAAGYATFWRDAETYKKEFFGKILPPTYGHRSSTLQDMERKIPTEIDSLNGAVVRMGKELGMDTPCNTLITRMIKAKEALYNYNE